MLHDLFDLQRETRVEDCLILSNQYKNDFTFFYFYENNCDDNHLSLTIIASEFDDDPQRPQIKHHNNVLNRSLPIKRWW